NNVLVTSGALPELFSGIVTTLTRVLHHDYTSVALLDPATNRLKIKSLDFPGPHAPLAEKELSVALEDSPAGRCILTGKPGLFRGSELDQFPADLVKKLRSEFNFEEIIGESPALRKALGQVELAAPANTTVLLRGETGTGKELFARAIHNLSPRRDRTFVKVNFAAIPAGLLESELFGHERGALTGAIAQKV